MPDLMIHNGTVVPRRYELLDGPTADHRYPEGALLPCHDWEQARAAGHDLAGVGLILEGDCDIQALRQYLHELPVIALHIPKFTDGRCYSHARRVRQLWGFQGDLLAYGDVLRDQLVYLSRVGVNAFYMRQDQDVRAALAAFDLYTDFYQYNGGSAAAQTR